jgi:photosystem I reaction center subunit XII|tara:strand:+ start:6811 stop:6954 length:144 start_codon:yes stop_codon:yes gene_type:complete
MKIKSTIMMLLVLKSLSMITDNQVFTALVVALIAGILAIRLGITLYS